MPDTISYGPLADQFGELLEPEDSRARPLVTLVHGGFWRDQYRLDLMHPLAESLAGRGYASWNIEYRRVGQSGGGFPTTCDDVAAAIDHTAELGWSTVAVVGHSAGGHLALWNASRTDARQSPALTISLAGVADVIAANLNGVGIDATRNFFGADYHDAPAVYASGQPDPARFAGRVVAIHGDRDDSVPVEQSAALSSHIDRVEIVPGADHFAVIDPDHYCWQVVLAELDALA